MLVQTQIALHVKSCPVLILFTYDSLEIPTSIWPKKALKHLSDIAAAENFKGKVGEIISLPAAREFNAQRVYLAGVGKKEELSLETLRRSSSAAARRAQNANITNLHTALPEIKLPGITLSDIAQAVVEGVSLGTYRFEKYLTPSPDTKPKIANITLVCRNRNEETPLQGGMKLGTIFSEATNFARDLVNEPASVKTPEKLAEYAKSFASQNVHVTIYNKKQLEQMGMEALLAVAKGSSNPPVLIHLHYKKETPKVKTSLCFVGKGITFDSGGLSLKPAEAMETMKIDMSGGAAILGLFKVLEKIGSNMEIHGIIPATENMPGGTATKPGDIAKAYNGKTIEILNTDAEGRLILADALSYAVKQNVTEIIDMATLTGACVIALGSNISGILSNNKDLLKRLLEASKYTGEKLWELPLEKEYLEQIKSKVADLKNISSVRREAGAIIGGIFLQEFVDNKPWAHIDIAGPAWTDRDTPLTWNGATGVMVRTLLRYILTYK